MSEIKKKPEDDLDYCGEPHEAWCECPECQEYCDHLDREEDILIGRWHCWTCGKRWF